MSTSASPLSSNLSPASLPELTKMTDTNIALEVVKGLLAEAEALAGMVDNVALSNAAASALLSADGVSASGISAPEPASGGFVNVTG